MSLEKLDGKISIKVDGEVMTEYIYQGYNRPILWPVMGPDQMRLTRNYPMHGEKGEPTDHPHHMSIWLAHALVNGEDFWLVKKGQIVHDKIVATESNPQRCSITADSRWIDHRGKLVCTDTTTVGFQQLANGDRAIDYDVTLHASVGDVTLGDTKEGMMAIRVHPNLCFGNAAKDGRVIDGVTHPPGHAVNSHGQKDKAVWGQRADWVDYFGTFDGKVYGVAMFDAPTNPRHPTFWHARDYGLFAANPLGEREFTGHRDANGQMKIPKGESVTFRYRIVLHRGDTKQAGIAEEYRTYSEEIATRKVPGAERSEAPAGEVSGLPLQDKP
ncbi:MAG: PmoA family protein [Planctomycetia bacterium]|nr:PmoA family protein [Planctomycetia bacterium]